MTAADQLAEARRLAGYWAPLPFTVRDWDRVRVEVQEECPTCGHPKSVRVFVDDPADDLRSPLIQERFNRVRSGGAVGVGIRVWGTLVRAGYYTCSGVAAAPDEELLGLDQFGGRSLQVAREVLGAVFT